MTTLHTLQVILTLCKMLAFSDVSTFVFKKKHGKVFFGPVVGAMLELMRI